MESNKPIYQLKKREDISIIIDKNFLMNSQISMGAKCLVLELLAFNHDKVFIEDFTKMNANTETEVIGYIDELRCAGLLEKLC